jgi:hypothetical protein
MAAVDGTDAVMSGVEAGVLLGQVSGEGLLSGNKDEREENMFEFVKDAG